MMKHLLSSIFLTATIVVITPINQAQAAIFVFTANLNGANEAPPNISPATGTSIVTFDDIAKTMRVQATFSGLIGNTTVAHIHSPTNVAGVGTAGVATTTPTFPGFPSGVTSGSYDNLFDMTLASSYNASFITNNGGTTASAAIALLNGLQSNKAYLNIHTTSFPGGEIRGFLAPVSVPESSLTISLLALGILGTVSSIKKKQ